MTTAAFKQPEVHLHNSKAHNVNSPRDSLAVEDAAMDYDRQGLRRKDYPCSKDKKEKPKHHAEHSKNILKLIYTTSTSKSKSYTYY